MALSAYIARHSDKPGSLFHIARKSQSRFHKVLKQFNDIHRQSRADHCAKTHKDLLKQWDIENENENRIRTSARYILLAQYTHILRVPLVSSEECVWPLSDLITRLLSAEDYLAKLITAYLITYINSRFYTNISGDIRYLARFLTINNRDSNMRNLHRNIKKITYLLHRKPGYSIGLKEITTMYNYLTSSKLSSAELVCEQQFTHLSNYVNSIRPYHVHHTVYDADYNLETNHIQVDDNDFFEDIAPVAADDGFDEEANGVGVHDILTGKTALQPTIDPQDVQPDPFDTVPVTIVSTSHPMDSGDMDDFTVIKKGKKGTVKYPI